jgi:hypothetical protein
MLLVAASAAAQPTQRDPEETVVADLVVTAPTQGPAWWKVSRGDSVVWIIGLPDVALAQGTDWDIGAFRRRVRGAKAFLASPYSRVDFPTSREALDLPRQARLAEAATKTGFNLDYLMLDPRGIQPAGLGTVMKLRQHFQQTRDLTLRVEGRMIAEAESARTPVERHDLRPIKLARRNVSLKDPEILTCVDAIFEEVETPVEAYRANAQHWAQGRALNFLAGPRGAWPKCLNRMMPGTSRRIIEIQTVAIAKALRMRG